MKILVTGTHFTPAQAVIEELKKYPDTQIIYVGRKTTMEGDSSPSAESKVLPNLGVKFIPIITGRLQREFTIYTIPSLLKIPIGILQSLYIILKEKPNVILSFGGYVGLPLVLVGWLFSIPIIIHEQTLVSGLANQIGGLFADKIALSFKQNINAKDEKILITGNPIRDLIKHPKNSKNEKNFKIFDTAKKEKLPVILITGGNQGSRTINMVVKQCLSRLIRIACIIHVTGESKYNDFERLKKLQNDHYLVSKWIDRQWGIILSKVDLVVSRSGINTLTELAYLEKPALVIPFEPLYQDEQNKNAKYFQSLGIVKILPQTKLSAESLLAHIKNMIINLDQLKKDAKKAKAILIPDAAKRLALETVLLAETRNNFV
ncbi:glycosyltransferase [Candidatus Daviesbacteria bacterium]|nr:glycosyltransferase [Candidatus Daviesbacteria bacterium]